jgi:hypothetical protein
MNIVLLNHFYVKPPERSYESLKSQLLIYKAPLPYRDQENFDKSNLLSERSTYIDYPIAAIIFIQLIMYLTWIFFRFHITFWINFYHSDEKNYYLIKKKIRTETEEEREDKQLIDFKQENRKKLKILDYFLQDNEKSNISISKFQSFYILISTVLFEKEIFFIIWGMIFNVLYLCTNNPFFIILQIASIYNFSKFIVLFVNVIKDKFYSFFTLLMFTWFVQYVFMWIGFLYMQELFLVEFRMIKDGFEYDDEVR